MPGEEQRPIVVGRDDIPAQQIPEPAHDVDRIALAEVIRRLAETYHPLAIYLFGSRARGDQRAASDYDLLVVVPDDAPEELQNSRRAYECLRGVGKAVDVLVCTENYLSSRKRIRTSIPARVMREGKVLYAA
jgi:uncharacterized protein